MLAKTLVFLAAVVLVLAVVLVAVLLAAGLAGAGQVAGLFGEGDPQNPPYSSLTADLGLPSPDESTQATSKIKALLAQAVTPAVLNV